ncbi:MAG: Uma2 family endonuclease [Acidobacteriia bacterium]|nr:Uma2 family endonuclease [Terriglobia bacterium]
MASNPVTKVTEEQYLALDRAAEVRSEFVDGEMWAMSGASLAHARLQLNLYNELQPSLRERGCEVLPSDFRVRVASRMYVYPDVTIVCGKPKLADERQDILLNPAVIFEILSPSTEQYDRGVKFQHHRGIESLKEYVLVEQDRVLIEQYTRGGDGSWTLRDYRRLEDELKLDSIGVSLPIARIYDRVDLPAS